MKFNIWPMLISLLFISYNTNVYSGTFVSLKTRPNVEQPFWLIEKKENAVASIILFAGGSGVINIDEDGIGKEGNFLVRTRNQFAEQGFNIAVVDKPSDQEVLYYFRTTEEHATDIKAVIAYMRKRFGKPVWLVGTSRGTTSVVNIASRLNKQDGADGIVLTSTISRGGKKGESVNDIWLTNIKQPTLFVHHEDDACIVCPPDEIENIATEMTQAKIKKIKMFSGGYEEKRSCGPYSYHGFLGIEKKVVKYIADWIKIH